MPLRLLMPAVAILLMPFGAAVETSAASDLDSDARLQGWWRFEDTVGVTAADSSPNKRTGKLDGGLSFDAHSVTGRIGKALSLDGDEGVVRIVGYKGILGTGPRSLSVWIRTDNPEGEIVSWGKKDFGRMWRLCFIRKHMGVHPEGGYYYMAAEVHDGEWHHVAAVVHEADLPNLHDSVTLYLDGEIAEIDGIGLLDLWPIETEAGQDVTIGVGFAGAVDELRIYDRELTDGEVAALYSLGN